MVSRMIPFNKPVVTGGEKKYIDEVLLSSQLSGDGEFTQKCHRWFEEKINCKKALLTTSCTHALEISALLLNIEDGDEIIMPSFTFVSTANAFVLRGAKIVFVDIRPDTMNIDEKLIESAITDKTIAIVPVHYASVACEMDYIMELANKYNLVVIEDAAQAMTATYKGKQLGTIGHLGAYSFHDTKNYTSGGEGGLLIINDKKYINNAEIIREKGTNRSLFLQGLVDKYTWVSKGSSYLPSELSAAFLWGQLQDVDLINKDRMKSWNLYYSKLTLLSKKGLIELPTTPDNCFHNAHIFYIKVKDLQQRNDLIKHLKTNNVVSTFHYVPLHSSVAGKKHSVFMGNDAFTTTESNRLLRLPLYYSLHKDEVEFIVQSIFFFLKVYGKNKKHSYCNGQVLSETFLATFP